jgi:hypothetical protein
LKVQSIRQRCAPFRSNWGGDLAAVEHQHLDWAGVTDMRRGFTGLSATAQTVLEQNPYILVAIQLEERDLMAVHPEYTEYRRQVPMIIPGLPSRVEISPKAMVASATQRAS